MLMHKKFASNKFYCPKSVDNGNEKYYNSK